MTTENDQPAKGLLREAQEKFGPVHMANLLREVQTMFGTDDAKFIIKDAGWADRMKDIPDERVADVIQACKRKLTSGQDEEHPLDVPDEPLHVEQPVGDTNPATMPPEALEAALAAINAIPDADRTVEAALGAVWDAWAAETFPT